jgi:hypothetical protein
MTLAATLAATNPGAVLPATTPPCTSPQLALQPSAPPVTEAARAQQLLDTALRGGGKSSITATEGLLKIVKTPAGGASFAEALTALRWGAIFSLPFLLTGDSDPRVLQSPRLEQYIKAGDVKGFFSALAAFASADPERARSIQALGYLTQRLLDSGRVDSARRLLQEVIGAVQKEFAIPGNPTDRAMDLIRDHLKPRAHPAEPVKPPQVQQAKPSPAPREAAPTMAAKPFELTQQQRREAEAQGTFQAQIAFNEAARAGLNKAVDAHRQGHGRVGGLVSQLYHKISAGEAGLGEIKTVRDKLQTQWNQMSGAANALNRSNGAVDLLNRANSNAQALYKQWPVLQQDPNASAWLKTFAGDLSNARAWADGLKGYAGGLRNFITATDRYLQQADAYRQGKGPKPVLPDFKPLANSGLPETPATRAAGKAMSDGYAAASKWLSSWLPQRAQPKLAMPPSQFDVPGANGGWRATAMDAVPAGMQEVDKAYVNVRTGEVSATEKTGRGWVEVALNRMRGQPSGDKLANLLTKQIAEHKRQAALPPGGGGKGGGKSGGGGWLPNNDNWWKWLLGLTAFNAVQGAARDGFNAWISLKTKEGNDKSSQQQQRIYNLTERMTQADGMPIKVKPYPRAALDNVGKTYPARADAMIKLWQHYVSQAGAIIESNPGVFGNDAAHHSDLAQQVRVKFQQYALDELSRLREGIEGTTEAGQKEALNAMAAVGFPPGSDGLPALAIGKDVVEQRAINRIAQQLQLFARASLPSLGSFEQKVSQKKVDDVLKYTLPQAGAVAPSTIPPTAATPNSTPSPKAEPTPLPTPPLPPRAAQSLADARTQLTSLHRGALKVLFPSAVPDAFARAPSFPTTLRSVTAPGETEQQTKDRARPLFLEAGITTSMAGTFYQRLHDELGRVVADLRARYPKDPQVRRLYDDTLALMNAATKLGMATDWLAENSPADVNGEPVVPR